MPSRHHLTPLVVACALLLAACTPTSVDPPPAASPSPTLTAAATTSVLPSPSPSPDAAASEPPAPVRADVGVDDEPCPGAIDPTTSCIRLGMVGDVLANAALVDGYVAFWERSNREQALPGYEVDVASQTRDSSGTPAGAAGAYEEIASEVLAIGALVGVPAVESLTGLLARDGVFAAPAPGPRTAWLFTPELLESGSPACLDAMNGLDHLAGTAARTSVVVLDDGTAADAVAGAELWGAATGTQVVVVAVDAEDPDAASASMQGADVVFVPGSSASSAIAAAAAPSDTDVLLTHEAHRTLDRAAVPVGSTVVGPWQPFGASTAGHEAMRAALGDVDPDERYVEGWVAGYALQALLRKAIATEDLTRAGLHDAAAAVVSVDHEGMAPESAGNLLGSPDGAVVRSSVISAAAADGSLDVQDPAFEGPVAAQHRLEAPCEET